MNGREFLSVEAMQSRIKELEERITELERVLKLVRASDDKHISRGETALHGNARAAIDAALEAK